MAASYLLASCLLVVCLVYSNVEQAESSLIYPHDAVIRARCKELGLYKLLGEAHVRCNNGGWSPRIPACISTTMLTNFTEDSPPTVLVHIPSGSASVEPSGDLAVFPGSILHLECLFSRKIGNPEWTWTSTFRQYLTGNIALHIFSPKARKVYDLDSLWAVGAEHDDLCNKPEDPLIALLQKHSVYLGDLQPNETNG